MRPAILGLLGTVYAVRGELDRAREKFADSETLYRLVGDVEGARISLFEMASLLAEGGNFDGALEAIERLADAMAKENEVPPAIEGELLATRAGVLDLKGDLERAHEDAQRSEKLFQKAGLQLSALGAALGSGFIANRLRRSGRGNWPADHLARLEKVVAEARRLRAPITLCAALCTLGEAQELIGQNEAALAVLAEAEEASTRWRLPLVMARVLEVRARVLGERALAEQARQSWLRVGSTVRAQRLAEEWGIE
jgi:ATP/maltotriose-dependent transcriptional regulator MalT